MLIDVRATLLVLNPTTIKQSLPQSTKTVQIVGINNEPQEVPISKPMIFFCLGPLRDAHPILLSASALSHLLDHDFLEKYHDGISASQKGGNNSRL